MFHFTIQQLLLIVVFILPSRICYWFFFRISELNSRFLVRFYTQFSFTFFFLFFSLPLNNEWCNIPSFIFRVSYFSIYGFISRIYISDVKCFLSVDLIIIICSIFEACLCPVSCISISFQVYLDTVAILILYLSFPVWLFAFMFFLIFTI